MSIEPESAPYPTKKKRSIVADNGTLLKLHVTLYKCRQKKKPRKNGAYQYGVSDGARTRDIRRHKPMLYQLSYTHHIKRAYLKQLPIDL